MISVSKLLCDTVEPGDSLRYGREHRTTGKQAPIVVWNCTAKCNLRCIHCYSSAGVKEHADTLTTDQAKSFITDLAEFSVPVILFSGGEPLLRQDIFELAQFARQRGLRTVLSTNGTLISREIARQIKDADFAEVGISLDGTGLWV
jgi:MoaA/NifB/PqqE/SkfB family radical SAM enzyme